MLPRFEQISRLPSELRFVRYLEEFEGPILSEYRAASGRVYVEKWCARDEGLIRFLLVRTDPRSLAEYMGGLLSLLDLLTTKSDGVCFLWDRRGENTVSVAVAPIESLPSQYLPAADAYHDESLRPEWETVPLSFLLDDDWSGKRIADVERRFLNVAGFAYFTAPGESKHLPVGVLDYNYEGGRPIATAFGRFRMAVPKEERSKSTGVSANSPGVLTVETTNKIATRLAATLRVMPESVAAYRELYTWSRAKPEHAAERMPDIASARFDLSRLCGLLMVDEAPLLPPSRWDDPIAVLTAAKLVASYWRQLWKLFNGEDGAEFISAKLNVGEHQTIVIGGDDDDDDDDTDE